LATVAELLGTSDRAARAALDVLHQRGILEKVAVDRPSRGRPATHYAATALLDATTKLGQLAQVVEPHHATHLG